MYSLRVEFLEMLRKIVDEEHNASHSLCRLVFFMLKLTINDVYMVSQTCKSCRKTSQRLFSGRCKHS